MRILIVEDEFTSRAILQRMLERVGTCDLAVSGPEAIAAFTAAREAGASYDLVCLDIGLPEQDGHAVLKQIRSLEEKHGLQVGEGVKVLMVTGAESRKNVIASFREGCHGYIVKPIQKKQLLQELKKCNLLGRD